MSPLGSRAASVTKVSLIGFNFNICAEDGEGGEDEDGDGGHLEGAHPLLVDRCGLEVIPEEVEEMEGGGDRGGGGGGGGGYGDGQ